MPQDVVLSWMFVFGLALVPWFSLDVDWAPAAATDGQWAALIGIVLFVMRGARRRAQVQGGVA